MDEDERTRLARQGVAAAELLEPGRLGEKVKESVADAAGAAALRGIAAVGRLTGRERSPARARAASAVDVDRVLAAFEADDRADFERRLHDAASRRAEEAARAEEARRTDLEQLRKSFPEPARELALLVFNCVDLLEDLSADAEGEPPPPAELARKEKLLLRIAELLAPRAGDALTSFVGHVVELSQKHRSGA